VISAGNHARYLVPVTNQRRRRVSTGNHCGWRSCRRQRRSHLWRVALIEVLQPASLAVGEPVGTFTFDGTTWSYDGPSTLEAGMITFSLVNTSDVEVRLASWFGLEAEELAAQLEIAPVGTDLGPQSDAPPPPPSDMLWPLVEAAPGESASATTVLGAGSHLIDAATMAAGNIDHLWRVALIEVLQP